MELSKEITNSIPARHTLKKNQSRFFKKSLDAQKNSVDQAFDLAKSVSVDIVRLLNLRDRNKISDDFCEILQILVLEYKIDHVRLVDEDGGVHAMMDSALVSILPNGRVREILNDDDVDVV